MELRVHDQISEIPASDWNSLRPGNDPFLRYEFLAALENHGCVGESWGWLPRHLALYDRGKLAGAMPLYLKQNSYGEFVFDWDWAEAYAQAGVTYYPKLVSAIPYTPATSARILDNGEPQIAARLLTAALDFTRQLQLSSLHILFTDSDNCTFLRKSELLERIGCQFHWHNRDYRDFDHFLGAINARQRKKIRRERRRIAESDIEIETVAGNTASEEQLQAIAHFYRTTFDQKWGYATLNLQFFTEIAARMGEQVVLILARRNDSYIAGALNLRSDSVLYGRHWGSIEHHRDLHFEVCYYRGIDYCIEHGLSRFEPGAQGEYKVSRGFEPVFTYSYHWIVHPQFRRAIEEFLQREAGHMTIHREAMVDRLPFRACN